jgi:uncharacterized protein YjbI with pentapeptide repeats
MIASLARFSGYVCALLFSALALTTVNARAACPPDCAGQTLSTPNFSHQDLSGANFTGATIIGGVFVRAKLVGAHFDNATFKAGSSTPILVNDFSHADLSGATFTGATFASPTYFTYATLASPVNSVLKCADFSNTLMNTGMAVFGDEPLTYRKAVSTTDCRPKFAGVKMNCEFIDDWRHFDLTSADVSACLDKLACREVSGAQVCRDFSGAIMDRVHLDNAILDGANFKGASLRKATLSNVSLQCSVATQASPSQCVDMSDALLNGANLNNANLTGASLHHASLTKDGPANIELSATLRNAHLKYVNLSNADLSGVDFTSANFFSKSDARGCTTSDGDKQEGFTSNCATAYGATIDGTDFTGAYLYAVDFRKATITGATFTGAVLVASDFSTATIGPGSNGRATSFFGAYLQGTNLDTAALTGVDLGKAYVDFHSGGNFIDIYLPGADHNSFACSNPSTCVRPPPLEDVCVEINYPVTTVPTGVSMTCPQGTVGVCGDPSTPSGLALWKSPLDVGGTTNPAPAGWYHNAATYTLATPVNLPTAMCNGKGNGSAIYQW